MASPGARGTSHARSNPLSQSAQIRGKPLALRRRPGSRPSSPPGGGRRRGTPRRRCRRGVAGPGRDRASAQFAVGEWRGQGSGTVDPRPAENSVTADLRGSGADRSRRHSAFRAPRSSLQDHEFSRMWSGSLPVAVSPPRASAEARDDWNGSTDRHRDHVGARRASDRCRDPNQFLPAGRREPRLPPGAIPLRPYPCTAWPAPAPGEHRTRGAIRSPDPRRSAVSRSLFRREPVAAGRGPSAVFTPLRSVARSPPRHRRSAAARPRAARRRAAVPAPCRSRSARPRPR